jgi:hypothetical protein
VVDNIHFYVPDPADKHSFCNHLLATRHSESCEISNSCKAGAMTFQTEENLATAAFQQLQQVPLVDTSKLTHTRISGFQHITTKKGQ